MAGNRCDSIISKWLIPFVVMAFAAGTNLIAQTEAQERDVPLTEQEVAEFKTKLKDPRQEDKKFTALVYNYFGYMWLEKDSKLDEGRELIKTAVDLFPELGAIADSRGCFYFKKGQYEEAKKELLRSKNLIHEPDAVILDHLAQVYYKLDDKLRALEYIRRAIKLKPNEKEFRERLNQFQKAPQDNEE